MKPRAPIVKRNLQRWKRKFVRNFHSKKRCSWIRSLPCAFCGGREQVRNAHMKARGMGGCGGTWQDILPVCLYCDTDWAKGRETFLWQCSLTWDDIEAKLAAVNEAWRQQGDVAEQAERPAGVSVDLGDTR